MKNKKAISLMVSYVILISIVITLAIGVFAYLKIVANISPPIDCEQGTSITLESYECFTGGEFDPAGIDLHLKNNGRFNLDGIILAVGNNPDSPVIYLMPDEIESSSFKGHAFFNQPLKPGETKTTEFSNINGDTRIAVASGDIQVIQIQPFILTDNGLTICEQAVIKQNTADCSIIV